MNRIESMWTMHAPQRASCKHRPVLAKARATQHDGSRSHSEQVDVEKNGCSARNFVLHARRIVAIPRGYAALTLILAIFCFVCGDTTTVTTVPAALPSAHLLGSPPPYGRGKLPSPLNHTPVPSLRPPSESKLRLKLRTPSDTKGGESLESGREEKSLPSDQGVRRSTDGGQRWQQPPAEGRDDDGFPPPFRALEPSLPDSYDAALKQEQEFSQTRSPSRSRSLKESEATSEVAALPSGLDVDCGWCRIPHPLKIQTGGEDVHLISRAGGNTLLAVFDGVGGWKEQGVDPAIYALQLSLLLEKEFIRHHREIPYQSSPLLTFLSDAFRTLEATGLAGSCTACAALLTADGALHVLNVGDSGLHVVRDGVSVFATNEQQHYFNCPFQLGKGSDDTPADADYYVLEDLTEDDTLVLATDGVWDNLWDGDWLAQLDSSRSCEQMARAVSEMAHRNGRDPTFGSPFQVNAQRHGMRYKGGKLDDVTVVVARVVRNVVDSTSTSDVSAMDDSIEVA